MAINTAASLAAYKKFKSDLAQAAKFTDRDMTNSGITRQRAKKVMAARQAFQAAIPNAPHPDTLADRRPTVFEKLAPKNADEVAVLQHEWSIVEAALKSGRVLQQVVHEATTATRLAAIAANVEGWAYSRDTTDPAGAAESVRSMVFDRLVEVGHEDAVNANATQETFAAAAAWNRVLSEASAGQTSLGALTELHQRDPEGYRGLALTNAEFDPTGDVSRTVAQIDHLVGVGQIDLA